MKIDYARAPFWYLFFLRKEAKNFEEAENGTVLLKTDKLEAELKPFGAKKVALLRFAPLLLVYLFVDVGMNLKTASLTLYSVFIGFFMFWYYYFSDIDTETFYLKKWAMYLSASCIGIIIYSIFAYSAHLSIFSLQTVIMASVYVFQKTLSIGAICIVVYEIIEFKNQRWWILDQQVFRKSPKVNYRSLNLTLVIVALIDICFMLYLAYK